MFQEHTLIFQAIRALGVDVPVMQAVVVQEGDGRQPKVILTLYGGQTLTWSPPDKREAGSSAANRKPRPAARRSDPAQQEKLPQLDSSDPPGE